MAKITTRAQLNVGVELTVDTTTREIDAPAVATGNLVPKDGIAWQALWSKLIDLWTDPAYQDAPFPVFALSARAGQYWLGHDGVRANDWTFGTNIRGYLRDAGWREYTPTTPDPNGTSITGSVAREYVGVVVLATGAPSGAQFYYQLEVGGAATDFIYDDAPNQGVQVFGDASNGNFDTRDHFRAFLREYEYLHAEDDLADVGETETGPYKIVFALATNLDDAITAPDGDMGLAPYSGIDITYYATDQLRDIGGVDYAFRRIVDGNSATLEQIYTKTQYLLRQASDIDSGAGTVIGRTADELMVFEGTTLITAPGVFIDNILDVDVNRVRFRDTGGTERQYPYTTTATLEFGAELVGGQYRLMFSTLPGAGNDWGEAGAVTVQDADGVDLAGTITSSVAITFAYATNTQGGRTAGTDADVELVAVNPTVGGAKYVRQSFTLTQSEGAVIAVAAELDEGYL